MDRANMPQSGTAKEQPREQPWLFRTYAGHSSAAASNALYRTNLARGQTGLSVAFDLPTQTGYDPDHPLAKGEVGKVGVPISHLGDMLALMDGLPLDRMNTSMTINATAPWLLSLYIAAAEKQGVDARGAARHGAERHHQGVPVARHLHLPAEAEPEAHRRRHRLRLSRGSEVEPDQRLLVPSAGSGRDAGAGTGLRAGDRDRGARPREDGGAGGGPAAGGRAHQLLRQCRPALHHRAVQDARLHRAVGRDHARALRRRGRQAAPLPLWRAGQFPRPDRAAAGEQRLSHPAGDAGRHLEQGCARPRGAAAGVERGARPAAAVGPAMVAAPAADPGVRDRPAGIRRHLQRLQGDRRQGRRAEGGGARGAQADR